MIDLTKTTFIIPLFIESQDRFNNTVSVLGFLNHHFKTNVILHEIIYKESNLPDIFKYNNLDITYMCEEFNQGIYHRTRQLNEMLAIVKTPVVVNYDIDVLLPIETYKQAQNMILDSVYDVVYPYKESDAGQFRVSTQFNREQFNGKFDLNIINSNDYDTWTTKCGHCIFLNTEKYISCGGENENFIAYGPEDSERYERFHKIGYRVGRTDNVVYHFEHSRTSFSNHLNEHFEANTRLFETLSKMSKQQIVEYYNHVGYINKYSEFKNEN